MTGPLGILHLIGKAPVWIMIMAFRITMAQPEYKKAEMGEITLHYQTFGVGAPLILIHGSLSDLRYWEHQIPELSKNFQVIIYSRRYNFPNINAPTGNHSALVEARDLLQFMDLLEIKKAHILGHSYGAYTALVFAVDHPHRVKNLILAEPPLMKWLPEIPGGNGVLEDFVEEVWKPLAEAYKKDEATGLDFTSHWYYGTGFENIDSEFQGFLKDNSQEWKELAFSEDAYPYVDTDKVRRLDLPVLLLSGEKNKDSFFELIESRLVELLPHNQRLIIENAGHEMFIDNPNAVNASILNFIRK